MYSADGCTEVQVISFADDAGFQACVADPDRAALRVALGDKAPEARVVRLSCGRP
jgi:hypothetical protein